MLLVLELMFPLFLLFGSYVRNRFVVGSTTTYISIFVFCSQIVALFFTLRIQHDLAAAAELSDFTFFYGPYSSILICFFHILYSFDFHKKVISANTLYVFSLLIAYSLPSGLWTLFLIFAITLFFALYSATEPPSRLRASLLLAVFACLLFQSHLRFTILNTLVGIENFVALLALLLLVYREQRNENFFIWPLFLISICRFFTPLTSSFGIIICLFFTLLYLMKFASIKFLKAKGTSADLFYIVAPFDLLIGNISYFVQTMLILIIYNSFQMFNIETRLKLVQSFFFCLVTCVVLSFGEMFGVYKLHVALLLMAKVCIVLYFILSERCREHEGEYQERQLVVIVFVPSLFLLYKYAIISLNPILGSLIVVAFIMKIISIYHRNLFRDIDLSQMQRLKIFLRLRIEGK